METYPQGGRNLISGTTPACQMLLDLRFLGYDYKDLLGCDVM
jgi:hypothetical protein